MSSPDALSQHASSLNSHGASSAGRFRLKREDLGILPLLLCFPFMYFPRVLDGDTQPWVIIGALVSLFTFRPERFLRRSDVFMLFLAVLCIVVFALRSRSIADSIRAAYTQIAFVALWMVARRENGEYFPRAVRMTIAIWFAVGLVQYVSVAVGHPFAMTGRFVEGRSGVPSLASEPSVYGSLSMLQMMYLLAERKRSNIPYLVMAATSVVLSGSLLAMCLFVFPLMKLQLRARLLAIAAIPGLVFFDYYFTAAGLTSRLAGIGGGGGTIQALFLDPSLNLRAGHIYFTLYENLRASLSFTSPVDFMAQYNAFAANSVFFIETGSNFILTSAGELIYGSGLIGLSLILVFASKAQSFARARSKKLEKIAFIAACMLNPIPISNVFLVAYAQRKI